jgi:hypothetical protein
MWMSAFTAFFVHALDLTVFALPISSSNKTTSIGVGGSMSGYGKGYKSLIFLPQLPSLPPNPK